jgi:hypothetical protein
MTIRLHIEHLIVDPRALPAAQVPQFQAALTEALGRLHTPPPEPVPRPRDALGRLAERTAHAIHQRVVRR